MSQHPAIFICYRRLDAAGYALVLYRDLARRFQSEAIFFDRQNIESGEKFPETLRDAVFEYRIALALIDPDWLQVKNEDGLRRLEDPNDFVRQKLSLALDLKNRTIPVLFDDTLPPSTEDLPEQLKALADRDVLALRGKVYAYDAHLSELVCLLEKVSGVTQPLPDPGSAERFYCDLSKAHTLTQVCLPT